MIDFKHYKELCYLSFYDENVVSYAYDMIIDRVSKRLDNVEEGLKNFKKQYKELKKEGQLEGNERTDLKRYATKEGFIETNNTLIHYYKELKNYSLKSIKEDNKEYSAYIDYFVKGKPFKIKQPTDFNNFFCYYADEFLQNVLYITFNWYGELDESNEEELRFKHVINANFNVQAFDKSVLELLQADNDKHFNFFLQTLGEKYGKLYKEMYVYVVGINERYKELSENIKDTSVKYEQLTLNLEYNDQATLTSTPLINSIAEIKADQIGVKDIALLRGFSYELDADTTENSEEQLNKLNELDRFVLDTIVVDFYLQQQITVFSDRQITTQYTNKYGDKKVSKTLQKDINESILKLQNIRVELDYKSIEKYKEKNIDVKRNNPLLWLESIQVNADTTSNYYKILGTPFYYTYLKQTNNQLIPYNRELLTMNIKGVDKRRENQDLRHYLIRRLADMNTFNAQIYIKTSQIYTVQGVNSSNYPTDSKLKKARYLARERTETLLNEFKKQYNFTYSQDNEGKRIKGYFIKPKNK